MCICVSTTYAFNGTEASKLSLEILLCGIIAQPGNNQGFESIASDIRVLFWVIC